MVALLELRKVNWDYDNDKVDYFRAAAVRTEHKTAAAVKGPDSHLQQYMSELPLPPQATAPDAKFYATIKLPPELKLPGEGKKVPFGRTYSSHPLALSPAV